ncbi:MAG TPA: hypothetical protein DER07_06480, partial [Armatimonadetes bacterium]|nr:hypothetical protein [Armatimonadota bacterium]
ESARHRLGPVAEEAAALAAALERLLYAPPGADSELPRDLAARAQSLRRAARQAPKAERVS